MIPESLRRRVSLAMALGFAVLLAFTAAHKILDSEQVTVELRLHGVLPEKLLKSAPAALAAIEFGIAGALVIGIASTHIGRLGVVCLVAFLSSVTAYLMAVAITKGTHLSCGCMGGLESRVGVALSRDVALLAVAAVLVWVYPPPTSTHRPLGSGAPQR